MVRTFASFLINLESISSSSHTELLKNNIHSQPASLSAQKRYCGKKVLRFSFDFSWQTNGGAEKPDRRDGLR